MTLQILGMTSSTILTVTCVTITGCVAVFMIVSIILPQWYTTEVSVDGQTLFKAEVGLFKECQEVAGKKQCITFKGEALLGL